ncbi:MAG: M16 family metallopeptidase [Gemmatimonadota bacterium]
MRNASSRPPIARVGAARALIAGLGRSLSATAGAVLLSLVACGAAAAQEAAVADPVAALDSLLPVDPDILTGVLDNGVRYYVRRNVRPEARAELRLVVNAGSVLEDEDQLGLAHFVEHMAFNGTERYPRQALVKYLESIGMRFGADLNAFTSFDETVYMLTVPTDSAGLLERAIDILTEWAGRQAFDAEEIDRERGVVIEEWRLGRGAFARMLDEQLPIILKDSRYAERLPIGKKEVLEGFDHATLRRYYADWYRPELMAVVAVGDFDPERVEAVIRESFAALEPRPDPRARELFEVPDHAEPLFAIATDPEAPTTSVSVYYKQPMRIMRTVGDYRRSLVEDLFNGMLNRRLEEIVRRQDPPFLTASSGQGRLVRSKEVYALGAAVEEGGVARGLAALLAEAERVDRHGFTASEFERAKRNLIRSWERAYAEREKMNSTVFASEFVRAYLEEEPVPGIAYEFQLVKRLIPGIVLDEVNRLAREWITRENRVVVVSAPEKAESPVPSEAELADMFDSVADAAIEPYVDEVTDLPLVAAAPPPARIAEERSIEEIGVTEWRLSNGVRIFLKPTDFKDDQILFRAYSPGGSSLAPDEEYVPASTAATVIAQGGVGEFDRVALEKKLTGKAVQVRPIIGELREGLSGSASPQDIESLFQLVYLYFTAPRADTAAFTSFRQRVRAFVENRGASPEAVFQDTVTVTLAQHHLRARPLTPELVDEMDLGESFNFYLDRFADASDFTFVFAGSFDPDSLRPLVRTYLGGLPSAAREERWRDVGIDPPVGVVKKTVRKGLEPKSQTVIVFTGPFEFSRESAFALGAMAEALDIVLRETLREQLGGTYGVQVGASATGEPKPRYSLRIAYGADPQRLAALAEVAFEQIARMAERGPPEDVLGRVKEQLRRGRETAERTNGFWVSQIGNYDRNGWDLGSITAYGDLVDALTVERVAEMARLLRPDNYVQVSLYPEE